MMLPLIRSLASSAFRHLSPAGRDEAIQEVIASAFRAYVRLVKQRRGELAYATPLAQFAIRRVRSGRAVAQRKAGNDVMSAYAQITKGIKVESLNARCSRSSKLHEVIVEDRKAGPAEVAAARIDVGAWLARLPVRLQQIALSLASGVSTAEAAQEFRLSSARISQLRRWFQKNWNQYQAPVF